MITIRTEDKFIRTGILMDGNTWKRVANEFISKVPMDEDITVECHVHARAFDVMNTCWALDNNEREAHWIFYVGGVLLDDKKSKVYSEEDF